MLLQVRSLKSGTKATKSKSETGDIFKDLDGAVGYSAAVCPVECREGLLVILPAVIRPGDRDERSSGHFLMSFQTGLMG